MISVPSPNHFWFTVGGEVPSHEIGGTPPALAGPGQRPAPLLLAGRQVLLAHQLRLVHGLRDGGELELTTPITNEFNPPPPGGPVCPVRHWPAPQVPVPRPGPHAPLRHAAAWPPRT